MIRDFQGVTNFIAKTLSEKASSSRVVINEQEDGLHLSTDFNIRQLLPRWLAPFYKQSYIEENQKTIEFFYSAFGERRVRAISGRLGLDIVSKYSNGHALTCRDVEKLYLGMGLVTKDDMHNIFHDLTNPNRDVGYVDGGKDAITDLRARFKGRHFDSLTKKESDTLYDIANPFEKFETIFFNKIPRSKPGSTGGYNYEELRIIARKVNMMRRNPPSERLLRDYHLTRKIVGYNNPIGLVIPTKKGYLSVFRRVEGGGSYNMLLKSMNKSEGLRSRVVSLGTHINTPTYRWVEQVLDILRPDLGVRGVRMTHDEMKSYLYHPEMGFVDKADEMVEVMGYSLGGIKAQRMAIDFPDKFSRLFALCPAGIDKESLDIFSERIRQIDRLPLKVRYAFQSGSVSGRRIPDHVSYVGDGFLGEGCDVKIKDLLTGAPKDPKEVIEVERRKKKSGFLVPLYQFVKSFTTTHKYPVINWDFTIVNNNTPSKKRLSNEHLGWEKMRKPIARIFGDEGEAGAYLRAQKSA